MSGYDLVAKTKDFDNTIDAVKPKHLDCRSRLQPVPHLILPAFGHASFTRNYPLIPVEVILGFAGAVIALICLLDPRTLLSY